MAFDATNQADLDALKSEIVNDPLVMGYEPTGSTQQLLRLLNDPSENVGGETTTSDLTVELLFDAFMESPGDLDIGGQFTSGDQFVLQSLLSQELGTDISKYRPQITAILPNSSTVKTTLDSQVRALSRAEVLFGVDTNISRQDWFAARDNGVVV